MNVQALKQQALAKVEAAYVKAEEHYGRKFTRVPVVFSTQQKSTAGTAHFLHDRMAGKIKPVKIKLSLPLLMLNGEEFIKDTPGHEAAHLISVEMFGEAGTGHGYCWQQVMHVIGQQAKRCHKLQTAVDRVEVRCSCRTHRVTKGIARKILAGYAYTCKSCKSGLTLAGATVIEAKVPVFTVTAPKLTKTEAAPKAGSKASIVVSMLTAIKAEHTSLETLLSTASLVAKIAAAAGLSNALCKTYIKNNWNKA